MHVSRADVPLIWWFCGSCGISGTSIDLYSMARAVGPDRAREEMRGLLQRNQYLSLVPPESLQAYVGGLRLPRVVSSPGSSPSPHLVELLFRLDAWSGDIARGIGGRHSQLLYPFNRETGSAITACSQGPAMPESKCRHGFVLETEIQPGLPCGWFVYGSDRRHGTLPLPPIVRRLRKNNMLGLADDLGLYGLGMLSPYAETVYVLPDPLTAMRVQMRWLASNDDPLPILGDTGVGGISRAVLRLDSMDTVIWVPKLTTRAVDLARAAVRGRIRHYPDVDRVLPSLAAKGDIHGQLTDWNERAEPWQVALVTYLSSVEVKEGQRFVAGLRSPLSEQEVELITEVARRAGHGPHVVSCLSIGQSEQNGSVFRCRGRVFLDRGPLGWFESRGDGDRLVSEACLYLHEVGERRGEPMVAGRVQLGNETCPFLRPEASVREDAAGFMRRLCVDRFGKSPEIADEFKPWIYEMSLARNAPQDVVMVDRVGWDSSVGAWIFPTFLVSDGEIRVTSPGTRLASSLPCGNITPTAEHRPFATSLLWPAVGNGAEIAWAILIAVFDCLVAASDGSGRRGIGLLGGDDTGIAVVNAVAAAIGMEACRSQAPPEAPNRDDIPVISTSTKISSEAWKRWHRFGEPDNRMVFINRRDMPVLVINRPWNFIDISGADDDWMPDYLQGLVGLLPFLLAEFQSRGQTLQTGPLSHIEASGRFVSAFVQEYDDKASNVVDLARLRLRGSPSSVWLRTLWCVFAARASGLVQIVRHDEKKPRKAHLIELADGDLQVPWTSLERVTKVYGGIDPDLLDTDQTAHVTRSEAGWVVGKAAWRPALADYLGFFGERDR